MAPLSCLTTPLRWKMLFIAKYGRYRQRSTLCPESSSAQPIPLIPHLERRLLSSSEDPRQEFSLQHLDQELKKRKGV
jgi:hypothetical protein